LTTPLSLPSGDVPVRLRTNPRARRMALRIDAQETAVDLVLPPRTSWPRALSFLEANRQWLEDRLAALPPRTSFVADAEIPILDKPYPIRHAPEVRGRGAVWIEDGALFVSGDAAHLARRVRDFLREMGRQEMGARARRLADQIGRKVGRVTVRDTSTRWGSCSADGNLAFCWRLIMAPERVLDYVVAHEVAHLVEMNHGPRFWKLVDKLTGDVEGHRQWLNENRARLLRIG
jgi:predicted metal-dependent hydrolase